MSLIRNMSLKSSGLAIATVSISAAILLACSGASNNSAAVAQVEQSTISIMPRTISVSGVGKVSSTPDMATITFSTMGKGDNAGDAYNANNKEMAKLARAIKDAGISDTDLQTSNFSLSPEYKYNNVTRENTIVGYRATASLTVKVKNIDFVPNIIDAAVEGGATGMNGLFFGFNDPEGLQNDARKKAIAHARAKAELYAAEAGVIVGEVISISEAGAAPAPRPMMMARSASMDMAEGAPIEIGENQLSASVNVVFAIK